MGAGDAFCEVFFASISTLISFSSIELEDLLFKLDKVFLFYSVVFFLLCSNSFIAL
jgi:hypothetical protein